MKHNFILDASSGLSKERLIRVKKEQDVLIQHFFVKEEDYKNYHYPHGDYFTLTFDDTVLYQKEKTLERVFSKTFQTFLKKYHKGGTILVIGLGNSSVIGDSFGPKVLEKLIATNQYNDFLTIPKVALFTPETTHKTGISSLKLIEMVVHHLKPDFIVLIDSFVTSNATLLNHSIEINDCGIIFADQLRSNKTIDYKTFHIPVLSIGFPCLLSWHKTYMTHVNIKQDIEIVSSVVSRAMNKTLFS